MRNRIVTQLILGLLNDDEILIETFKSKFAVLTTEGKAYNHTELTLAELYSLLAEGRTSALWLFDYPSYVEGDFGEPVEFLDDITIFPQGIAHIQANAISVEV